MGKLVSSSVNYDRVTISVTVTCLNDVRFPVGCSDQMDFTKKNKFPDAYSIEIFFCASPKQLLGVSKSD